MATPTIAEIVTEVQGLVGDPNGDVFTSVFLTQFINNAFSEMVDLMINWDLPAINRDAYYVLPAYTNRLTPAQAGISDMGEPEILWERGSLLKATITGVSNTTPVRITTAAAHGFSSNSEVDINGVPTAVGINTRWLITVIDPLHFDLNGSVAGGLDTTGTATYSTDLFVEMTPLDDLPQADPNSRLVWWRWINEQFEFIGATQERQIWIQYTSSGDAPASGSVGVDKSKMFLSHRAAGLSMATRGAGAAPRAEQLNGNALGPSSMPDGTGGYLRALLNPMLKEKQKRARSRPPFRRRRNIYWRAG